jgi:hypothetical protein
MARRKGKKKKNVKKKKKKNVSPQRHLAVRSDSQNHQSENYIQKFPFPAPKRGNFLCHRPIVRHLKYLKFNRVLLSNMKIIKEFNGDLLSRSGVLLSVSGTGVLLSGILNNI